MVEGVMVGLVVAGVVLVCATVFGLVRRRRDGSCVRSRTLLPSPDVLDVG